VLTIDDENPNRRDHMRKQLIASSIVEKYVSRSFHGVRGEAGFLARIADRL